MARTCIAKYASISETMKTLIVPLFLVCGPLFLSSAALLDTFIRYRKEQIRSVPLYMVGGTWVVALYAAYVFLRYTVFPPPGSPPPWNDPETLDLAMLFFLAPIGFAMTVVAGNRGASRQTVIALLLAMFVLFVVGMMEVISV